MKTQIPIYRAKKIDSDEYIEGYYIELFKGNDILHLTAIIENDEYSMYNNDDILELAYKRIDPSTLAISFDGNTWYNIDTLSDFLDANKDIKSTGIQELT